MVEYSYIVEADSEDDALAKYEGDQAEHEATDIGDPIDGAETGPVEVEEIEDD